jgi:hypothetical protein
MFLQDFVNSRIGTEAPLGFWYSNAPSHVPLRSVQFIFLWGYTNLSGANTAGMPFVDDTFTSLARQKSYVVLLALTPDGLARQWASRIGYHELARAEFDGHSWRYYVAITKLDAARS